MKKLEYRCPWCGELLNEIPKGAKGKIYFKQFDSYARVCNYCENMSTRIVTITPVIFLIIGLILVDVCPNPRVAWIPFIVMMYLVAGRIAYKKKTLENGIKTYHKTFL